MNFLTDQLIYVGQKAFIGRDGEVLIIRDPNIGIDFPGGKIKEGETDIVVSLKREVREETSLEIEVGDPFVAWYFKFFKRDPKRSNKVYLVGFRCKYVSGEVRLSTEHTECHWVNRKNYKHFDDGSSHFRALEKYFTF